MISVFIAALKPEPVVAQLRAEQWPMSSAKRNPANAVNFDTILPAEAVALKRTPITVTLPCKTKPVSLHKPASLSCFTLCKFKRAV